MVLPGIRTSTRSVFHLLHTPLYLPSAEQACTRKYWPSTSEYKGNTVQIPALMAKPRGQVLVSSPWGQVSTWYCLAYERVRGQYFIYCIYLCTFLQLSRHVHGNTDRSAGTLIRGILDNAHVICNKRLYGPVLAMLSSKYLELHVQGDEYGCFNVRNAKFPLTQALKKRS